MEPQPSTSGIILRPQPSNRGITLNPPLTPSQTPPRNAKRPHPTPAGHQKRNKTTTPAAPAALAAPAGAPQPPTAAGRRQTAVNPNKGGNKKPTNQSRAVNWAFTVNNYTDQEHEKVCALIDNPLCRYICVGKEHSADDHTPHLQGYVQFTSRQRFITVKEFICTRAHLEVARARPESNQLYCQKEGDYFERGEIAVQGQRNDLARMKDDAHHLTVEELVERYGEHWMRYRRSIKDHLLEEVNDHALYRLQ